MKILLNRINDSRKWIKFCWTQNNRELANKLQKVKKAWINKLKRLSNYEKISESRLKECMQDPYGAWNKIKRQMNKNRIALSLNKEEIKAWATEFENQFKSKIEFIPQKGCSKEELWDFQDIQKIIKKLPNKKAPGPDNIRNEIIKKGGDIMAEAITHFLNSCKLNGIPDKANEAKTILIYKGKGNPKELNSYRPITLMNNFMKILDKAELKRIENTVNISERQHGFTKGKSCMTQIFLLKSTLEYRKYYRIGKGRDSYILFVDFSKAYDSVNRIRLLEKIKAKNIKNDSWKIISQMLKGEQTTLVINGIETEKINITRGVRQGSAISPLLFNIYIDDIEKENNDINIELLPNHQLKSKINFQYADDTAFVIEDWKDIENILNKLDKWSKDNDMNLNIGPEKTAIMPIITKNRKNIISKLPKISYQNHEIPVVEKYKYLGKIMNGNIRGTGFDQAHYKYLKDKSKISTCSLIPMIRRMLNIPSKTLINCFKAIFLPRCTYGLEICSRIKCKTAIKQIQRSFNKIIRECCHVYDKTPIEPLLLDLNIPTIQQYIDQKSLIFLQKIFELTHISEIATHFLRNFDNTITPTMKIYQELLQKYNFTKPFDFNNNMISWNDKNWKGNVKDKLKIYWRNENMSIINKKVTLKMFKELRNQTFTTNKLPKFWILNKNLITETRIKAAWRYGAGPSKVLVLLRNRNNQDNIRIYVNYVKSRKQINIFLTNA
ncbi:unnamed protein product [Blepharisma stoltei]|uniref:Reverse transcriptase domain-containing protein n=1 Tax=Blepharisma stoltei TaxID=1481888 RepID=A0AAU9JLL9_9CILI|nr:unnamed protein product [Blepharisma stoltei]